MRFMIMALLFLFLALSRVVFYQIDIFKQSIGRSGGRPEQNDFG